MAKRTDPPSDLLIGMIALDEGMIDAAQLLAAYRAWSAGTRRSMGEELVKSRAIDRRGRARLEALAAAHPRYARSAAEPGSPGAASTIAVASTTKPEAADDSATTAEGARYRVLAPHASGGLGEVSRAFDPELQRDVALKELHAFHAFDPVSQARFLLEAEVTGRLEHPGIVPVYGLGRHADGRPYYAMRLIEGETLEAAIERFHRPRAEGEERARVFRRLLRSVIDACNTVAFAHSRGIVHRDLKPANIMIGPFGETIVVDWGIAKPLDQAEEPIDLSALRELAAATGLTLPGAPVGTPRYMSPEQAAGEHGRVGPASDVYGLGATLYHVLVGRAPFPEGDLAVVLDRVRRGIFPAPRRLRRSIDPGLEAICLKAMSLKPEARHPTALALGEEIEAWLTDVRFRGEQEIALGQMKRSLALFGLERAHRLFGMEKHGEGMLWLARALEHVPADHPQLERAVRASLGGWHARGKLHVRTIAHGGAVFALAFSPDGRRLATGGARGTARLWDVSTGKPLTPPLAHDGPVRAVAVSPDEGRLATAGDDGMLRLWDARSGRPLGEPIDHGAAVLSLCFARDGRTIATACRSGVPCLWSAETGRAIGGRGSHDAGVLAVVFSGSGRFVAAGDEIGHVWLWGAEDGEPAGDWLAHEGGAAALAFSVDGSRLLTAGRNGTARLWDLDAREMLWEAAASGAVVSALFHPSGETIALAIGDGTARFWEAATGRPKGEPLFHRGRVGLLAYSPDWSILATGSDDGATHFWDAHDGLAIGPPLGHAGALHAMAFHPEGRWLATGCVDGAVRLWKVPAPIPGHPERISCWIRAETGLELDEADAIRSIDPETMWELRRLLYDLGGPPVK